MLKTLNRCHILYLGALPALATIAVLNQYRYEYPFPFLLFLGGIASVGIYLATSLHYTETSTRWLVLAMMDGPVFSMVASGSSWFSLSALMSSFLIDGIAIWAAIGILLFDSTPSFRKRLAAVAFSAVGLVTFSALFWPHLSHIAANKWGMICIGIAMIEAVVLRYYRFKNGVIDSHSSTRYEGFDIFYVTGFIFLWIAALSVGIAFKGKSW